MSVSFSGPKRLITCRMEPPGAVAQPPIDPARPHMHYPAEAYRRMLAMPDAEFTATRSQTQPPVKV